MPTVTFPSASQALQVVGATTVPPLNALVFYGGEVVKGDGITQAQYLSVPYQNAIPLPTCTFWNDGTNIYARIPYNSTKDLAMQFTIADAATNGHFEPYLLQTIPKSNAAGDITTGATALSSVSDDYGPLQTNLDSNTAGGHGWDLHLVTKAGHGLTSADIGKHFVDAAGTPKHYRVMLVGPGTGMTADQFVLCQQVYSSNLRYPPTTSLTVELGDTCAASPISGFTSVLTACYNFGIASITNRTLAIVVDGVALVPGAIIVGQRMKVVETYDIWDPSHLYSLAGLPLVADCRNLYQRVLTTQVSAVGMSCTEQLMPYQSSYTQILADLFAQFNWLTPGGSNKRFIWVPETSAWKYYSGTEQAGLDYGTAAYYESAAPANTNYVQQAQWLDSTWPPAVAIEYEDTTTTLGEANVRSHTWMIDPTYMHGAPILRKPLNADQGANGSNGFRIAASTGKRYLASRTLNTPTINVPTTQRMHRAWSEPPAGAASLACMDNGKSLLCVISWITAATKKVQLPDYCIGLSPIVIRSKGASSVLPNPAGYVDIVSTGVGYTIIRFAI
jgi:hypothetical protein